MAEHRAGDDPIEEFIAFYEGSGLTNMRPDAARAELARLRAIELEYEAVILDDQERARAEGGGA